MYTTQEKRSSGSSVGQSVARRTRAAVLGQDKEHKTVDRSAQGVLEQDGKVRGLQGCLSLNNLLL